MNPPIEDSIVQIGQDRWLLGYAVVCEVVSEEPKDALKSWRDDGKLYCLRTLPETDGTSITPRQCGNLQNGLFHHAGTSAAAWNIGGMFIKVEAWRPEMQLESDTIRFVNRVSSLPTPNVIYSWVDTQWSRSFLILKTIKGRTLNQAWNTLSSDCRTQLANTVGRFCKALAISTSERLETADGKGIVEPFLTTRPANPEPLWKPQLEEVLRSRKLSSGKRLPEGLITTMLRPSMR